MTDVSIGSVSLVRQREHTFYSFTISSEILGRTCYVVNREEDPAEGFQRELDKRRAEEIAFYIDSGLGTIPSSIVLSAQPEAELNYNSRTKTITFKDIENAFLIIDGQHRVYGFRLAKSELRIPVIVYDGLSKRDESRLFIDINSKQKGVPPELLLDIKRLADYETDVEAYLRDIFDRLANSRSSVLYGKLSNASKQDGKLTRAQFNRSIKPLIKIFGDREMEEVSDIIDNYLTTFHNHALPDDVEREHFFKPNVFRAVTGFFPSVAARVKNRFGPVYTQDTFFEFLKPMQGNIKKQKIAEATNAYKPLLDHFEQCLDTDFKL